MRPPWSKKGDFGKVLIVGGSERYVGAPALAGMAALAAGADIVKIAAPERVAWAINSITPDLITLKLEGERLGEEHVDEILAEEYDSLLVGNGLGRAEKTMAAVKALLEKGEKLVVDADALKAKIIPKGAVLTPHLGEFEILFGERPESLEERKKAVKRRAKENSCVILLKGHVDVVSDGEKVETIEAGNPRMTVGGTGDTLAGVVAALRAVKEPYEAAVSGATINGKAGDSALKKFGAPLPSLLVKEIPRFTE